MKAIKSSIIMRVHRIFEQNNQKQALKFYIKIISISSVLLDIPLSKFYIISCKIKYKELRR